VGRTPGGSVAVGDAVAVGEAVAVPVAVGEIEAVAVAVAVGVAVPLAVAVAVAVEVGVAVAVGVGVGVPPPPWQKISIDDNGVMPSTSYPPDNQMCVVPSVSVGKLRRAWLNGMPVLQAFVPGS